MANCVTCGRELHPERAEKYDYCTDPECQRQNAKSLTILALGVNKAADHYQLLDERTRDKVDSGAFVEEAASGKELAAKQPSRARRDRDRGPAKRSGTAGRRRAPRGRRGTRAAAAETPGRTAPRWTRAQQDLAVLYSQQGMRPDQIAAKLRLDTYTVTQMILAGERRARP
jgi:hypothetical protein